MIRAALVFAVASAAIAAPNADSRLVDAVKSGDKAAAVALLKNKTGVNVPEADGTTPLQWAVRQGDQDLADQLLKAGADVKAANRYGVTALYLACLNGDAAMIEKLIKAGADANAVSTEGETALMTASRAGSVDAVKALLNHGAMVDARESWHGETALMWAAGEKHTAVMKELIARGADVNARSNANKWERQVTSEPRDKWLPMGALTPLMFSARQGCVDCEKVLLDAGADKNAVDPDGISSMLLAIINGHYDAAEFLVTQGADPNLADKTGRTALYSAVDYHTPPQSNRPAPKELDSEFPSLDLIKDLLAHNANVNAQLKTQQPYRTKLDRGDDTMLTTGTTPLLRAAKAGDTDVVKLLLDKGADPKLATRAGITPLMAVAGVGSKEEDTTGRRKTEEDAIQTIDLLLKAGVDPNAAEGKGLTAMHGAAQKGYDKVIAYLADHGAKVDVKDKQGKTPLDAALGRSGGLGFDGTAGEVHSSTAELLQKLAAKAAVN
jgi:ankyrin repeat protein